MDATADSRDRARWRLAIDTGGTFTDCVGDSPDGRPVRCKVLSSAAMRCAVDMFESPTRLRVAASWTSVDDWAAGMRARRPGQPADAVEVTRFRCDLAHGRALIELAAPLARTLQAGDDLELAADLEAPVLAAHLATGTPVGDALPPIAMRLATTRTTNALLERKTAPVLFVTNSGLEDLLDIGDQRRPDIFAPDIVKPAPLHCATCGVEARLDSGGKTIRAPQAATLRARLAALLDGHPEIRAASVALLHALAEPAHELGVARLLRDLGIGEVCCSHEVPAGTRLLDRAQTATVDAGLSALLGRYIARIQEALGDGTLDLLTSAGGLAPAGGFRAKDSLLSGPAGGVAGAAAAATRAGFERCIAFDMGGTSTDVSRFDGEFDYRFTTVIDGQRVCTPCLRIETVASGGGSVCRAGRQRIEVGPQSAGATPGPASYGAGGPLALTDVHLLLGRIDPEAFAIPVDIEAAKSALRGVLADARLDASQAVGLLDGFLRVADQKMAAAIRSISGAEGYDPSAYALTSFGGAGGLHACRIAGLLGIRHVLFPADAGLLSAIGLASARREKIAERRLLEPLDDCAGRLPRVFDSLAGEARRGLQAESAAALDVHRRILEFRLAGQEATLTADWTPGREFAPLCAARYREVFGYSPGARRVECVSAKVVLRERASSAARESFAGDAGEPAATSEVVPAVANAPPWPVIRRADLAPGQRLRGRCLVQDAFSTLVVEDGWHAQVGSAGTLRLHRHRRSRRTPQRKARRTDGQAAALIESQLFANRLAGLVDEAGNQLERTAVSTNVKDRRDFSCALLDAGGRLVVNAPHIPVHLGALGPCVRRLMREIAFQPGDVIVTNHPAFGGSHLPDITVVTPFFIDDRQPAAFLASRAHHAELGGIAPGSMPPAATRLDQEGVIIAPLAVARAGASDFAALERLLAAPPHPSRSPADNLADIEAQIAANQRAASLLRTAAGDCTADELNRRFTRILEASARALVARLPPPGRCHAAEFLDDGTRIEVAVEIASGRMAFDFTGSSPRHPGNLNATAAIVNSALLYVLRLLVSEPLPLNEGLLDVVDVRLPRCFLDPGFDSEPLPAVAAGNTETSQRLVDTLMRALGLAACSQGTMNNLLFGNHAFGYYETIGGGAGASRNAHGADAVHSHMTNTAITDPEVLERRYPVRLREFAIRSGSGGRGHHHGGAGITREIEFLETCEVSLITQHRVQQPYGLDGGQPGQRGRQWLLGACGDQRELDPSASLSVHPGDRIRIETPGGGGWG